MARPIGIYEKATPKHFTWLERLNFAKELSFDFVEMSIDERDERLASVFQVIVAIQWVQTIQF